MKGTTIDISDRITERVMREISDKYGFMNPSEEGVAPMTYDWLVERHRGLPKECLAVSDIPYRAGERHVPTGTEPASGISEGLTITYPTDATLRHVCDSLTKAGYPIQPSQFGLDSPNSDGKVFGHVSLMVHRDYLSTEMDRILRESFGSCGYDTGKVFTRKDQGGNQCTVYQFEPRFQRGDANHKIGAFLWHVTTASAAEKILRKGFCPSNRSRNGFMYKPRNYFFTVYDKGLFADFMMESGKENRLPGGGWNSDFTIISVDVARTGGAEFFTDPNFADWNAVFTYSNIPPSAIAACEPLWED